MLGCGLERQLEKYKETWKLQISLTLGFVMESDKVLNCKRCVLLCCIFILIARNLTRIPSHFKTRITTMSKNPKSYTFII